MCGLGGILCFDPRWHVEAKALQAMARRLSHRGPDATGQEQTSLESPYFATGLVHCRLSILDLDPRANQPMSDAEGRFSIVFNGEIYNFRELRQELEQLLPGFRFRTRSDTEVLIAAYRAWGEKCLNRLNGMFAFVIIDHATRTVFAARDRLGQKPLYLAAIDADGNPIDLVGSAKVHRPISMLAFASEIGPLLELAWVPQEVRTDVLNQYLLWGYIPSPHTLYRGILALPPAHAVSIILQQSRAWRYFDPNQPGQVYQPHEDDLQTTRRLVLQAVKRQLVSDVPVGCFLSGGIDSSIVAAAMKQACGEDQEVLTFSIGFDDPRYDETPHALALAHHLKTTHRSFTVKPDAAHDLPIVARSFGQPFADSSALPTYYLAQVTRQAVKVALSGDGGDELFGGYDRYRAMRMAAGMPAALRWVLSRGSWQRLGGAHPKSRLARMKRFAAGLHLSPGCRYARYMELFAPAEVRELLGMEAAQALDESYLCKTFEALGHTRDEVQAALALDRLTYLPEDLLVKVDRCSMQHALEVRSPFMDHELVQFAAALPTESLIGRGSKTLLRQAFSKDMPAGHFSRPKMGFAVPVGEWFRAELRAMLHDLLLAQNSFCRSHLQMAKVQELLEEHEQQKRDHSQRLYALLMLELWSREQGA
jgi:asparagine synthase (glutamine-hydrolysing)